MQAQMSQVKKLAMPAAASTSTYSYTSTFTSKEAGEEHRARQE
jgi:hypothetical protein